MTKLAITLLVACTPRIVYRDVKPACAAASEQPKTCLSLPPPKTPRDGQCTDADEHACRDMHNARLDDATHDAIVKLPHLDGRLSIRAVDAMWKAAWERIHVEALVLAQVWIDKHPEAVVDAEGAKKARAILDSLGADDALHARWMESCHERARHFIYR